jgi:thiol-disulfide isomerase/thioredoxin
LYFTAKWCVPCRTFSPKLVEFRNTNADDFQFVMVSWDRSLKEQQQYIEKTKMAVPAIRFDDPLVEKFNREYRIEGVPTLLIFDSTGRLITSKGRECLTLPIRPTELEKLGNTEGGASWQAMIAPYQKTLLATREEELKALEPVFEKYADFPKIDELRNWQGYYGASAAVERLMAEVGREIGNDWENKQHHLEQLITLALEMKPQTPGYRGLLEVYSGSCFRELGRLSTEEPEIVPVLCRLVEGADQTGSAHRNCRNWGVQGVVTAAVAGNQDAFDKIADWESSIKLDHAPLTICPALSSACAEANPRALQLARQVFARNHYYVHAAFGLFVPAALQGNRTALDTMAEIAAADDVRGYEVHARQVIQEAARRGSAYAETLLKKEQDVAGQEQEDESTDGTDAGHTTDGENSDTPTINCTKLDGKKLTSTDLRGRIVVVHFWSTACASCVAAMPRVAQAYDTFAKEDVLFLGVCGDKDRALIDRYIKDHDIIWPQTMDAAALCKSFGVAKYPAAFILDAAGKIQWSVHPASLEKPLQKMLLDQ